MNYIVVAIGCLECGNDSLLVGVFATLDEAKAARPEGWRVGKWVEASEALWAGDVVLAIFQIGKSQALWVTS